MFSLTYSPYQRGGSVQMKFPVSTAWQYFRHNKQNCYSTAKMAKDQNLKTNGGYWNSVTLLILTTSN